MVVQAKFNKVINGWYIFASFVTSNLHIMVTNCSG